MKKSVDLNCDMGEGFGGWQLGDASDVEIMKLISSANIATGFHAGDPNIMNRVAQLSSEYGVGFGAHPGYKDLQGFGRRFMNASDDELVNDIVYQVGALREFGRRYGLSLQHVKLHGALYMEAAKNAQLSRRIIEVLMKTAPEAIIYCMAGSETEKAAADAGYPMVREFYADRDYDNSGSIVFTRQVCKLDTVKLADKCLKACQTGTVETVTGDIIDIEFDSICFHSDAPGALENGRAIKNTLTANGIAIASPAL